MVSSSWLLAVEWGDTIDSGAVRNPQQLAAALNQDEVCDARLGTSFSGNSW
jgi:hypothetical protein